MKHIKRAAYFPQDIENFAPWVAKYGLVEPYGKCQCGCGQDTSIAKGADLHTGRAAKHPCRFVHGHNAVIPIKKRFL